MSNVVRCRKCGKSYRLRAPAAGKAVNCPSCGSTLLGGERRRMYVFERAYGDYAQRLRGCVSRFWDLCLTVWAWFWEGPGAKALEVVLRVCVAISGVVFGVMYVRYELANNRGFSFGMIFAFCIIAGYAWLLMWGWKAPVHVAARAVSGASAAGTLGLMMLVATVVVAIVFGSYLLLLFVLTGASLVVFVPMRVLHWLWLFYRHITYECPYDDCRHRGLPIHICSCGHEYPDLYPSFYGIFHHICRHGDKLVKLPTMDFLGRKRLPRRCGGCKRPLIHSSVGELAERPIFLAGGPSTGKSVFLRQAIRRLPEHIAKTWGGKVCIDSPEQRTSIERDQKRLDRGQVLAKTVADVVHAFGLAIRVKKPRRLSCLLYVYDPPGEDFTSMQRLGRKQVMQRIEGIILLVDPFATPALAKFGRRFGDRLKASSATLHEVTSELIGVVNQMIVRQANEKCQVPLAVVLNKTDALPAKEHPFLADLVSSDDGAQDRCRQALERLGEGRSIRALEQKFETVRYFACSALGRMPDHRDQSPFRGTGATEPFLWLLKLNGAKRRR